MTCAEISLKPKLRGIIHGAAFFCTLAWLVFFTITSYMFKFNLGILIYLVSQLLQFGVSASYHIPDWSPGPKTVLRYIDHMCIFLLISGTQTSVLLNGLPSEVISSATKLIKVSWAVSIIGISRLVLMRHLYDIFDLICYITHGMMVLPFYSILRHFGNLDLFLIVLGGILYLIGGIIYGLEKPNPSPTMFGYHEIFHAVTIIANACFGIVISKDYVISMLKPD